MEKYRSEYPTLRQAKTKWSNPSIVAKQGEGPSHGWYEMLRKDAKAKLAASIRQSKLGSMSHQTKIVHEEAGEEHLYHVTHTKHVGKIQKHGLKPMQTSNWVKAGDKERYGGGEVYTFTHKDDAHQWAGRMDWAHHQKLGSGNISIVTVKKPKDHKFEVDDNDPLSQAGQKGKWLKTHAPIAAHHIVGVEKYMPKKLGEDRIGKPTKSAEQIAKKHNLSVDQINAQIKKGIEVEKEHTDDERVAHEIARDHISEFPDYYDRLGAMEKAAKKEVKEGYDPEKEILKSRIETHRGLVQKYAKQNGERSPEAAYHRALVKRMEKELDEDYLEEDAVPNSVGGGMSPVIGGEGNIHGFDPIMSKPIRRRKFAGKQVFVVDPTTYHKAYLGKRKYEHYEKYLEGSPFAEEIRAYGRKYWDEPIILENEQTGAMVYLKYGSK